MSKSDEQKLIREAIKVVQETTVRQWVLGELASKWHEKYSRGRTDLDFSNLVGTSRSTVFNCRTVWNKYGANGLYMAFEHLSFTHFVLASAWDDGEAMLRWADEQKASLREMEAYRNLENEPEVETPAKGSRKKASKKKSETSEKPASGSTGGKKATEPENVPPSAGEPDSDCGGLLSGLPKEDAATEIWSLVNGISADETGFWAEQFRRMVRKLDPPDSLPEALLGSEDFGHMWTRWKAWRNSVKTLRPSMVRKQLELLAGMGAEMACAVLDYSMTQKLTDLHPKRVAKLEKESKHEDYEERFEIWWNIYPRKEAKGNARRAFKAACKRVEYDLIEAATRAFVEHHQSAGTKPEFIPHPASWLRADRWEDERGDDNSSGVTDSGPSGDSPTEQQMSGLESWLRKHGCAAASQNPV